MKTVDSTMIISKAVIRAAEELNISHDLLAKQNEREFALKFVTMFLSLNSIVGNDKESAQQWLLSNNQGLNGRPIDLICEEEGLDRVVDYLESFYK